MKLRRWAITLSFSVVLLGSLVGFKSNEIQSAMIYAENFPEHSETVTATKIQQHQLQSKISVMGSVVSPQRVMLRNESAGRITQIAVRPNQQVMAGDLLVQLDVSSELAKIQATKARRILAKLEVNRFTRLHLQQSVSLAQLDTAKAQLAIVDAERAELDSAIALKTVRAPFDGVIGLHRLELGLYLELGSDIGELLGQQTFTWVEFSVPQFYPPLQINDVVLAQPIQNQQTVSGLNKTAFNATVIARNIGLTTATRSVLYRAQIALPKNGQNEYFAHNMAVKVQLPIGPKQTLFKVPASALQFDGQSAFIYLLDLKNKDDNSYRAKRRNVIMVERFGDQILLASDPNDQENALKGNELLASQGAFKLQPNMLVYAGGKSISNPLTLETHSSKIKG